MLTEFDIEFTKLLKCVMGISAHVMRKIAKEMYKCACAKIQPKGQQLMTINQYMEERDIKVNFGETGNWLDCDIRDENFDVAFANKIIKDVCEDIYNVLSEECKNAIGNVVGLRNYLCHSYYQGITNFTSAVTETKSTQLKLDLACVCDGVAKTLNESNRKMKKGKQKASKVDFKKDVEEMKKTIDQIISANITVGKAEELLTKFKANLEFSVITKGIEDLDHMYERLKTISPCVWQDNNEQRFDLETVFTLPELSNSGGKFDLSNLLTEKLVIVGRPEIPQVIIVQGDAGSGKTSLCRFLVNCWKNSAKVQHAKNHAEKFCGVVGYDMVIFVEMRRVTTKSLEAYLSLYLMKTTFRDLKSDDVMRILSELKLLFIIDGYDEGHRSHDLVNDIFKKVGNNRIILTTRKHETENVRIQLKHHNITPLSVELMGFSSKSREIYVQKVFNGMKANQDSCDNFIRYLNGRGKVLREHLNLPLTISLLIVLWMDNPDNVNNVTTATSLYREIFNLFLKKLTERLIITCKNRGADQLHLILHRLLFSLGEQAWSILKEGLDCILGHNHRKQFDQACEEENVEPQEFLSAFLNYESNLVGDNEDSLYFFFHKTQTEYLAALFLANRMKSGTLFQEILSEVKNWQPHMQLLIYLTGNMAIHDILQGHEEEMLELVNSCMHNPRCFSYWWNIVSESRIEYDPPEKPGCIVQYKNLIHPKIGEIIAEKYLSNYVLWEPEFDNVAAALRLIALIPVHVERLVMEIPKDKEPYDIPDFIEAIEEVGIHHRGGSLIDIELLLYRHETSNSRQSSDRFLRATQTWAKLTTFIGGIEDNMHLMEDFTALNNIQCRVTNARILNSFRNFRKYPRVLRITVDLPPESSPDELIDLEFRNKLELCFNGIKDDQIRWVLSVVDKLSHRKGCDKIHLHDADLSYKSIKQLTDKLHCHFSIKRQGFPNEEKEIEMSRISAFKIEWIH